MPNGAVAQRMDYQFLNDDAFLSSLNFIHYPEVWKKIINKYPQDYGLRLFKAMGMYKSTQSRVYRHKETRRLMENFQVAAVAAAGNKPNGLPYRAGSAIITIANANHTQKGTRYYSYPVVGQIIELENKAMGVIRAKNDTVFPHTITVEPLNASYNILTSAVPNAYVIMTGTVHSEGSGMPKGRTPFEDTYENNLQIFKDTFEVTRTEAQQMTWLDYENANGETKARYYYKGEFETAERFMAQTMLGLFLNDRNDNILVDEANDDKELWTTRGYIPTIRQFGQSLTYTIGVSLVLFDDMIKLLNQQSGSKENLMLYGINFGTDIENVLVDFFKQGSMENVNFTEGGKKVNLEFKTMTKSGYKFMFDAFDLLNHPTITASPNFSYPDMCLVIPTDSRKDLETSNMERSFQIRHFDLRDAGQKGAMDGGKYACYELGGMKGLSAIDEKKVHYLADQGVQCFAPNRHILIERA